MCVFVSFAFADEKTYRIAYSGKLTDTDGNPISGIKSVTFQIGDWSETQNITFNEGLYSVHLGEQTSLNIEHIKVNDLVLKISIEGEVLEPDTAILHVPKSIFAELSSNTEMLDGKIADVFENVESINGIHGDTSANVLIKAGDNISIDNDTVTNTIIISSSGLTTEERTKLNSIESQADKTDADNVAQAGAVMDEDFTSNGILKKTGAGTYGVTPDKSTEWDTAYNDRMKWDGGNNGLNSTTAKQSLGLVIGTNVQAYDSDLADLADGSLNGSKVGSGINANNITTGTLNNSRFSALSDLGGGSGTTTFLRKDGQWTTPPVSNISASNITSGTLSNSRFNALSNLNGGSGSTFLRKDGTWTNPSIDGFRMFEDNILIGTYAGYNSSSSSDDNIFIGEKAGYKISTGDDNIFIGKYAGRYNDRGGENIFIGTEAGFSQDDAYYGNVYIGYQAGRDAKGEYNIFLGYGAGWNESGSNKFIVNNTVINSSTKKRSKGANNLPLIYGEFDTNRLGINTKDPSYTLDINGKMRGSTISDSDIRLKKKIKPIEGALKKLMKIAGVIFEWIDSSKGEGEQIGVIAQEVQPVFPQLVSEDRKGILSVDYSKMVAVLIEAVKEQQAQINELQAQIYELQNR